LQCVACYVISGHHLSVRNLREALGILHYCCKDVCIMFEGMVLVHRLFITGQQKFYANNPFADTEGMREQIGLALSGCVCQL
jgi:hypothetical protein